jgi:hypothetical protein
MFREQLRRPAVIGSLAGDGRSALEVAYDRLEAENARRRDEESRYREYLNDPGDDLWWQEFMHLVGRRRW